MLELVLSNQIDPENPLNLSLDELARLGVQKILHEALELEIAEYISKFAELKDSSGKRLVVRNGKAQERTLLTGTGEVKVRAPRINDRRAGKKFESVILPPFVRKSPNVESVIPILYLKGLSGNAFTDALAQLFGEGVKGLSAASICSLKKQWQRELDDWRRKPITEEFVYLWCDGVNVKVRLGEDKKLCLLVVMGVTATGEKKLLAVESGYRESKEAWKLLFSSLESRGLNPPLCLIGDGALGMWAATRELELFKSCKEQRCWVHKIANVLDKLPKRVQPHAKKLLHDMMRAPDEASANISFKQFQNDFHQKYPKAVSCLVNDWEKMTTFFSFPAQHWAHIRTTNPIESSFATVKQRTKSTKGAGSVVVAETMAFKLLLEAEKRWQRIKGAEQITKLLSGAVYKDGEMIEKDRDQKVSA